MDARSAAQWIVAVLVIVVGAWGSSAFAGLTRIYGRDFNLPLLDPVGPNESAMTEATIEVPDHFIITDLNVRINITHTKVFDLQLFLQSPAGKKICLNMYNPFYEYFDGENYTQTIFDDEAEIHIKQGQAPFTGRFKPIEPYELSEFDSQDSFGLWHLQIYDMWPADTGTLDSFHLIFTIPEPATMTLLTLGIGLATLFRPRRNQ